MGYYHVLNDSPDGTTKGGGGGGGNYTTVPTSGCVLHIWILRK